MMDYIVNILVRFFVFLSRFAPFLSKLGLIEYRSYEDPGNDTKLHILLAGYNGVRNTGSDIRVAEIARQLEEGLGKDRVEISVMALDTENLCCYFADDVHLIPFNTIFFWALFKACCANQAVILCEGSTFKSKFANALTLYSCEAAGIMKNQHKPCIAYGSEAGDMDAFVERAVRSLCKDTYCIARTRNTLDLVQSLGLKGHLGTDAAWRFDSSACNQWAISQLRQSGWDGVSPLLGIAPINPFCWPVKPSLIKWLRAQITGDHSLQYQLWYFFSWSKQRKQQFEAYLDAIADAVNAFAEKHPCHIILFGMEKLDGEAVNRLKEKLRQPAAVILSSNHNGCEMAAVLRQLSLLITSRYHAEVLSMEAKVPCVAISMDERLDNIMREMDMDKKQLLHADDGDLASELKRALDYIQSHEGQITEKTGQELLHYQRMFDEMGDFLTRWLLSWRENS